MMEAVVSRVFDGFGDNCRGTASFFIEYLAGHDADTVAFAGAAGNAGDADTIIIDGGYGTGAVGSVRAVLPAVPDDGAVVHEVVTMLAVGTGPHVGGEIGMSVFYALVHDCYDDGIVTGGKIGPDILDIDIGSGVCIFGV